jgi:hypothetical protein
MSATVVALQCGIFLGFSDPMLAASSVAVATADGATIRLPTT